MQRTEQGKSLRKAYESHEIKHGFNEYREPVPRNDGITNTISTVQKDNLLIERERRNSQSTSPSINREESTEQTVSRQDTMLESQISGKTAPVLLSCKGTKFEKFVEFCSTLMARDFKGFGNQAMTGVITVELKDK
jgi:hypothetical protein